MFTCKWDLCLLFETSLNQIHIYHFDSDVSKTCLPFDSSVNRTYVYLSINIINSLCVCLDSITSMG